MVRRFSVNPPLTSHHLKFHKLSVESASLHQLLVDALLSLPALAYGHDLVGVADGGQTVGDDDGGPALSRLFQPISDKESGTCALRVSRILHLG